MTTTNQTKREEFGKLATPILDNLLFKGWELGKKQADTPYTPTYEQTTAPKEAFDKLWQWITAFKDQAVSEERVRTKMIIAEYFGYIGNDGVTGKPINISLDLVERDIMKLLASLPPKEVTKQSDNGGIK